MKSGHNIYKVENIRMIQAEEDWSDVYKKDPDATAQFSNVK